MFLIRDDFLNESIFKGLTAAVSYLESFPIIVIIISESQFYVIGKSDQRGLCLLGNESPVICCLTVSKTHV